MIEFIRKPFISSSVESINEILEFSQLNAVRPYYSSNLHRRFLTQLASSSDLVLDLFYNNKRIAVAVLLDKVNNPSNAANLEIIGRSTAVEIEELFQYILPWSLKVLPKSHKAIQVGFHNTFKPTDIMLHSLGFKFLYNTYEMKKFGSEIPSQNLPPGFRWQKLNLENFQEYYQVLTIAFKNNLETSIPPIEEMRQSFKNQNSNNTTLLFENKKIVGFRSIAQDEVNTKNGEIHMLGLLPTYRSRGLGKLLLCHAMEELKLKSCENFNLTVAAENMAALELYKQFGFTIDETYTSYQSTKPLI